MSTGNCKAVDTESDDSGNSQQIEMKTETDSDDVTLCPRDDICDTQRGQLSDHRGTHTADELYSCTQCDRRFAYQKGLRNHMNIHRGKFKCPECGKPCGNCSELAVHVRSHSGEKPFECTVCGKQFTQSGSVVKHSRIHSGQKLYVSRL